MEWRKMKYLKIITILILLSGCAKSPSSPLLEFNNEFGIELPKVINDVKFQRVNVVPDYINIYTSLWRFQCDESIAEQIFKACSMHPGKYAVIPYINTPPEWPIWWKPPPEDIVADRYYADYGTMGYAYGTWINGVVFILHYSNGNKK